MPSACSDPAHFRAPLATADPQVAGLIAEEAARQSLRLDLVASENLLSRAQLEVSGSILGNVTTEGYPGARMLEASAAVDALERLAVSRACQLFDARFANVQPHSGTQANQAVFLALLEPGDCFLSMSLADGGHFSHGDVGNMSGRWFRPVHYHVRASDGLIDYDEVERLAQQHRPKLVVAGSSAYPRHIDFVRLGRIAHAVGAPMMVDIAHVAGLVATGDFPHPFPHADVVTSTTYKNLRGVHGGLVLTRDADLAARIDAAVCPGVQGTPLLAMVAGKAVAFGEALRPAFATYSRQVLANARALAATLLDSGLPLVTGGTDTPFVVIDMRALSSSGRRATQLLDQCHIGASPAPVPGDTSFDGASGLRLGVSAVTTRGLLEQDCAQLGRIVAERLHAPNAQPAPGLIKQTLALCERFPVY